jgi:hypothetical protein
MERKEMIKGKNKVVAKQEERKENKDEMKKTRKKAARVSSSRVE